MTLTEYLAKDRLADIAKGRYSKKRVEEMFRSAVETACKETERLVFEYAVLMCLQELHYEFGFGKVRLERFFNEAAKAVDAFDAGAFGIDDMRQALKDDAGFECSFNWGDDE